MGSFRSLIVYQKAFKLAMDIFKLTKDFPSEERNDLISQIRNSSRSEEIGKLLNHMINNPDKYS